MEINLRHGSGGHETSKLIQNIFMKYFKNQYNSIMLDSSILPWQSDIAFTTDSYVVKPIFFRGGDIGKLAVCGTVNDLLTSGAKPMYLSASFIIEEGLKIEELEMVVASMSEALVEANVSIVTGDTKVIEGNGGLYINTAGVGIPRGKRLDFKDTSIDDKIIVTSTLGDHYAAIMSERLGIDNDIKSDVAPLSDIINNLLNANVNIRGMRDITRGGLGSVLNELSEICNLCFTIYEKLIPVSSPVMGLCELLGLNPLYMGNEGNMLIVVDAKSADLALEVIKKSKYGSSSAIIGELVEGRGVVEVTKFNSKKIVKPLMGESLPRIC